MANEFVARKGILSSGSVTLVTGSFVGPLIGTASFATTASAVSGGARNYIPLWTNGSLLSASLLYQSSSQNLILGEPETKHPEAPPFLEVNMPAGNNPNIAHFHADVNDRLEFDIKNYNSGPSASTNIFLIADSGTPQQQYMRLGLNSSTYAAGDIVEGPNDAFLIVTGSNLLMGNIGAGKTLILFNGSADTALENARFFVGPGGTVGINTDEVTLANNESLFVRGLTGSINIATFRTQLNSYGQINVFNESAEISASSDIVATANNGSENEFYINMGINSSTYSGPIGDPNDAYLYSTGNHLHIGNTTPGQDIMFFIGSDDVEASKKLTLRDTNQHDMTGSLSVSGSMSLSAGLDVTGSTKFSDSTLFNSIGIEKTFVSSSGATGTINFDILSQPIVYFSGSAAANFTLNFRGNSTTTLNSILQTGQTVTVALFNKTGNTPYSASVYQIDGTPVTPLWLGGSVPQGLPNRVDVYSYSITKTAASTYTVLASLSTFG
jgi:hypothetical protein